MAHVRSIGDLLSQSISQPSFSESALEGGALSSPSWQNPALDNSATAATERCPPLPIHVVANLERVTDAVDPRNRLQDHFYDIEPITDTGVIEHSQPFFGATDNPFLFS
jgi:hypothetical protein